VLLSEQLDHYTQDPSNAKLAKQELSATQDMIIEDMENMSENILSANGPHSSNGRLLPYMHCSNGVRTSQGQRRAWEIKVHEKGAGGLQVAERGQLNNNLLIDEDMECVTSL
ncbi:voltage-dependent L-type calcium channel subunit alpha-1C isoform X1, partial [Tachysurus ichikawai]